MPLIGENKTSCAKWNKKNPTPDNQVVGFLMVASPRLERESKV
jgi:hypothetical protein